MAYICHRAAPTQVEALQTIEQQEAEIKRLRQQLATSRAPPVAASPSDAVLKLSTPRSLDCGHLDDRASQHRALTACCLLRLQRPS